MAQYNQDRSEFIEKFRKEQGLDAFSYSKTKINTSQHSSKTSNARMNNNNISGSGTVNQFTSSSNRKIEKFNVGEAKRWDFLHHLEKVKQSKIEQKKQKQIEEKESKHQQECTFTPVFYSRINRSKSKGRIEHQQFTDSINSKMNKSENDNELLNCDVNQRTAIWSRKKEAKNETIKQQLVNREFEECNFKPKTVSNLNNKSRIQALTIKLTLKQKNVLLIVKLTHHMLIELE